MKLILKIAGVIVIAILLVSSVYVIFFTGEDVDNEPPSIDTITRDTTGKKGESITIFVTFSDNINVTNATIFYKTASEDNWSFMSILSGSVNIYIPKNSDENWYYYVTVDDAAGNGPVGDPSTNGSAYYTITVLDNGDNGDDEFFHTVFIEEGTATDCHYCPDVRDIIHELYASGDYRFYYVSLVQDMNSDASDRLTEYYNNEGVPTVFIDGGYKVIKGGNIEISEYIQAINAAESRDVPKIQVTVNTEYENLTKELTTKVFVENKEDEIYTGRLKVYLTEIVSRWNGNDDKPYHFGFLEYIIDRDISVNSGENASFPETQNILDLDHENLMIIAVVFSSESHQGYSNPPDEDPFDAYYADATDATEVVPGGNLPPSIGITSPETGKLHIRGIPLIKTIFGNTILIGKTTIRTYAEDDSDVKKVEFYINDELKNNDTEEPYEWTLKRVSFIKHIRRFTITVKVYDDTGKTATTSLDVISFRL